MKAKIFCISDNVLLGKKQSTMIAALSKELFLSGYFIESTIFLPANERLIEKNLLIAKEDNTSIFIVVASEGQGKEFLSKVIASITNDTLVENAFAKDAVLMHFKKQGLVVTKESEKEFVFPSKSRAIVNGAGESQGYVTTLSTSSVFVLPFKKAELIKVMRDAVLPYLSETIGFATKNITLKTFGISSQDLNFVLKEEVKNKNKVSLSFFENGPLVDVVLKAKAENQYLEELTQTIFQKISKFVYAEEDISLQEACFNLLNQTKQTLSVAESISGGEVASSLIKNNEGASNVLIQGVVAYTNQAKMELLGVSPDTLSEYSAVSSEVAYEMASGMLQRSKSDLVVATTGYASHENQTLNGLCYVAVGNQNAIHIFKNKFVGNREENIEAATACALFFLIKKLRKNDFHFEKTVV